MEASQSAVWADDEVACIRCGLAPLSIFRPDGTGEASFKAWRDKLRAGDACSDEIVDLASELRKRVLSYTLPFLSLPTGISRETALALISDFQLRLSTNW